MCRGLGLLRICSLIGIVKGLNPGVISRWSVIVWAIAEALPGWGGGVGGTHVARLNFETSRVSVFKCLLLIVGLWRHCGNLAEGGCLLLRFHFTRCCYLFGHVACQNLPWQGLIVILIVLLLTVTDISTTCAVEAFELCTNLNFIAAMIFFTLNSCCH